MSVNDRHLPLMIMDNPLRRYFWPAKKLVTKYVTAGMTVADLGCGSGYHTMPIAEIVGTDGKVFAVDSDGKAIGALQSKAQAKGYNNIIAEARSATNLDFIPAHSVDLVFSMGMICCTLDHHGAIQEIKRIMNPDGHLYISVSRPLLKQDRRNVGVEEWAKILKSVKVVEQGRSLTSMWAYCTQPNRD